MGIEAILIATAAVVAGAATTGMAVSAIAGGGGEKGKSQPEQKPIPQAPNPAQATDKAQKNTNQRRSSMTQSVYTSPLGIQGEADVTRKTLLGQ